ncbi:MAG TPA: deoxyguanosinetriphosphate triphosphohydrolase [Candidatus Paceibacterota bacterium]|nr:deoxyguanosinetriphosphate triphosphohydrolase [Verrucomicrobiota bacterium]HRY48916.1 deoxyguanosinetriphosphate triphosphohydrolase [Candidatus Paceibacterota bacterium]HRZ99128.1 deoxyguanosinetriphosphate triphosphohydrolase [Candidatus Paceibacterota bacterium]
MPCSRQELEERERRILAPYAQLSSESRGRKHPEDPPDWRTQYQRDRDRVIHSRAFRRLEYKTQVFLNGTGDHLRTRLTHTIEVAAIARNIARALKLNEDLAETIALAHDLGHSPFGHKGEMALNQLMKNHGGFEHNRQSLRIVEELEQKYPGFPGLNLTWEVREGLIKHATSYDDPDQRIGFEAACSSLEAQVANLADEITYYSHDLDDGLDSGLLEEDRLGREVELWRQAALTVQREHGQLHDECRRYFTIRCLIDGQVRDVVHTADRRIQEAGIQSADEARTQPEALVVYSPERRRLNLELRDYLYHNLYYNPIVHEPNLQAVRRLEELFRYFLQNPDQIGEQSRRRAEKTGWPRAICDYLAGMTDRYLILEHQRLLQNRPT